MRARDDSMLNLDPGLFANLMPKIDPGLFANMMPKIDPGLFANLMPKIDPGLLANLMPTIDPGLLANLMPKIDPGLLENLMPTIDLGVLANLFASVDGASLVGDGESTVAATATGSESQLAEALLALSLAATLLVMMSMLRAFAVAAWLAEEAGRTLWVAWTLQWQLKNATPQGDLIVCALYVALGRALSRASHPPSAESQTPDSSRDGS